VAGTARPVSMESTQLPAQEAPGTAPEGEENHELLQSTQCVLTQGYELDTECRALFRPWLDVETGSDDTNYVRFEVFAAVTMKNGVFWDVTPSGSCKNRRFGGT
jgi:hypothetical protein